MSEEQYYTISTSHMNFVLIYDIVLYKSGQTTYTLKPTRDKPNVIWHDDRRRAPRREQQ